MRECEAEWTYRLSPPEIVEIETAVMTVLARGLDLADIRREDFPLPTLGPVLDRLRTEVLDGRGFALLRGMPVEDRPIVGSATEVSRMESDQNNYWTSGSLKDFAFHLGAGLQGSTRWKVEGRGD